MGLMQTKDGVMFAHRLYIASKTVWEGQRKVRLHRPQMRVVRVGIYEKEFDRYDKAWTAAQAFNAKQKWME